MPQDEKRRTPLPTFRQSLGASALAKDAVSILSERQGYTVGGARQFILDYLMRTILSGNPFFPSETLDTLCGHRLSVDAIIDIYVPAAARLLGERWMTDELDFASVTIGGMRLQALLSVASDDSVDFLRPLENSISTIIVVPLGEQHTLGAFVLAAQLRRLGARVEMSFCETAPDVVTRVLTDPPDVVLFTASGSATLETVAHLVLDVSKVLRVPPLFAVGGSFSEPDEEAKELSGVDIVTRQARDALSVVASYKNATSDKTGR